MVKRAEEAFIRNQKSDAKLHPFDDAIQLISESDGYLGHTSENYANMIGPFGGVVAAVILKSALDHPECQGEPIALTINYAAPIADGDFKIKANPVRTNRSTQHWSIMLSQKGQICATATSVFAVRRKTWSITDIKFPNVPDVKELKPVSHEMLPKWMNSYDIRIVRGEIQILSQSPVENPKGSVTIQYIKDKPDRKLDFLSLAAMSDSFVPRIFVRRKRFANAGTVSLTLYFHADSNSLAAHGDQYLLGHARALRFYNNYSDQTAEVWGPNGELLVTTSQVVYFKE